MYLGYPSDFGDDIRSILHGLKRGRSRGLNSPFTYGLPIIEADRFGLLLAPRIAENMTSLYSYFPSRFDNFVSFTCDDGIAIASIKNTGIRHWSNDNCLINNQHRDHSVFGLKFRSLPVFTHDNLFFNPKNGDLWRIDGGF